LVRRRADDLPHTTELNSEGQRVRFSQDQQRIWRESAFCRRGRVEPTLHQGGTRHSAPLAHGGPSFGSAGDGGRMQAPAGAAWQDAPQLGGEAVLADPLEGQIRRIPAFLEARSCFTRVGAGSACEQRAGCRAYALHTYDTPGVWRGTDAPVDTNAGPRSAVKAGPEEQNRQNRPELRRRPPLEPSGPSCASHRRAGRGVDRPVRGACTSLGQGGGQEGRGQGRVSLAASGGCKSAPVLPCCGPRRALGLVHIVISDVGIPGNHLPMPGPV
jgi:hypothetical protein